MERNESFKEIKNADTFEELYAILRKKEILTGMPKEGRPTQIYHVEDLIKLIEIARTAKKLDGPAIKAITRNENLQATVIELMQAELMTTEDMDGDKQ